MKVVYGITAVTAALMLVVTADDWRGWALASIIIGMLVSDLRPFPKEPTTP